MHDESPLADALGASLDAGPLDSLDRALVTVFAATVRSVRASEIAIRLARDRSVPGEPLLEMLLQVSLFAGYPRCINALAAFRQTYGPAVGAGAPVLLTDDVDGRRATGEALFRRIYGADADRVLADLARYHPVLRDWILVGAYGKVLARSTVDVRVRELAAVGALIASGDVRQLSSHVRGARRCGATLADVRAVPVLVAALVSDAARTRAERIMERTLEGE